MEIGDELLFFINGTEENLSTFADKIPLSLPLSLYFIFKSVEVSKEMTKNYASNITRQTTLFDLSLEEMRLIQDSKEEHFCDIFEMPSHKINCQFFYENSEILNKEMLKDSLLKIVSMLQNGKKVRFQTIKGEIALSLQNDAFDFVIANDIATISFYTRANRNEIDALATWEKPFIKLFVKEVFANEIGFKEALFILPYDPIVSMLCSIVASMEIPFIFASYTIDNAMSGISYHLPSYLPNSSKHEQFFEIILGENGYFLEKKFLDTKISAKDFVESNFLSTQALFVAYLSYKNPTILRILGTQNNMIHIAFDINPKHILRDLSMRPNGKKLVENYAKLGRLQYVECFGDEEIWSENLLDILGAINVILGFSSELTKENILEYAILFLRDIGPRIDFKTISSNGNIVYDPISSVSSALSFTLAGMENETLCYGILDSLADFLVNLFRDVEINYGIKDMAIIGDLFANKIFFNKITKKIPQNIVLHLPNYIDMI